MSPMQPKPRPRAIFPASHPATRPSRSHDTKPCDSNHTRTVLCVIACAANMNPPGRNLNCIRTRAQHNQSSGIKTGFLSEVAALTQDSPRKKRGCKRRAPLSGARLLLGHAVQRAEAEHQIAAGDADDFAIGK